MNAHHLQYPSNIVEMLKDAAMGKPVYETSIKLLAGYGFLEIPRNREMIIDETSMTLDFKISDFGKLILKENAS